jgi:RPA family protein
MSADDGPISNREVAWRLFAAEFRDADMEHSEADEERAPNYVIAPTGARVNRLFVVGVLTEVEQVGDDILRGRVVDPTGAFVVYAGQYQPDAKAFLQGVNPPMFVAVTGKARTFQPDDSDVIYTSVRPEVISEVDADTRDRWAVQTARHTLHRVSTFDDALALDEVGDALEEALLARGVEPGLAAGIPLALDHYGTTREYLAEVHDLAIDSARVVAGEIDADEVGPLSLDPDEGRADVSIDLDYTLPEAAGERATEPATAAEATEATTSAGSSEPAAQTTASESEPVGDESVEAETGEPESAEEPAEVPDAEAAAEQGVPTDDEPAVQAEQETTTGESFEPEDGEAEVGTDETGSEMYELDEEERQEIEENYPTEFSSGAEVGEPGEADIEPAGAAEASEVTGDVESTGPTAEEAEAEPAEESLAGDEGEDLDEIAEEVEAEDAEATEEPPEELDEALMGVMADLNEGEGVTRADLEAEMADRYGASAEEVGEAIDDALMGGQCYESGDDVYMPI